MGLREDAEKDLEVILEDPVGGFGWDIVLTNPAGNSIEIVGFTNDTAQIIDPETGVVVSGRLVSVTLRMSTILAAAFELPVGIADRTKKPWLVQFNDINGVSHKFKVMKSAPDRTLGVVVLLLESFL